MPPDTSRCPDCGEPRSLDPIYGRVYATCGNCSEPGDPDGADLTGGERISLERETQAAMQRDLK